MARVYIEYQGDSIELPVGETVVGRDVGCALRFNDSSVSRRHLRFVRRGDDFFFVEDLGSTNGTLLNGRVVAAPIRIHNGDIVAVGNRELIVRVVLGDDDEPAQTTERIHTSELEIRHLRAATLRMAVTTPPPAHANQRCPRCGAAVSSEDPECAKCQYRWDNFRAATPTNVMGMNPLSRRRHARLPVELHIVYISSELEIEATTRDLSESGVFVCSQVLDPLGTRCQLTILVDGGPPLRIGGVVRRVVERHDAGDEPVGIGVEFVELGESERAWLKTMIARMAG